MPDNCCPLPFFLFSNPSQSLWIRCFRGLFFRENAGTKQRERDRRQQCYPLLFSFFIFSFSSGRVRIGRLWVCGMKRGWGEREEGSSFFGWFLGWDVRGGGEVEDKLKSAVGKNKFCNDIVFLPKPVLGEVSGITLIRDALFLPHMLTICPKNCPKFNFGQF